MRHIPARPNTLLVLTLTANLLGAVAISPTASTTEPAVQIAASDTPTAGAEVLTADELAAGWRLLFDGVTTQGWRGFRQPAFPSRGWVVEDRVLKKV
jgi:hypothetical protein